ncbi:MAG: phage distal tail protein, Rcc01695 family [Allorhizobium sp.]
MESFHEVRFPLRLSLKTSGGPVRQTDIVNLSNGREVRNLRWRDARRRYDAGSGIRSVADLYAVLEFFEARSGGLCGFRFADPVDFSSGPSGAPIAATDQVIGSGDGLRRNFQLTKTYGDAGGSHVRTIVKPENGSVVVAVNGAALPLGAFACNPATGLVTIQEDYIPSSGAIVQAGYRFDVPVRFDIDRIEINLEAFNAGRIPAIPLMEILA